MNASKQRDAPEQQPPLAERLREVRSFWRRTPGDYFFTGLGYFASALIFVVALVLGLQKAEPSERLDKACIEPIAERAQLRFSDTKCPRPRIP